MKLFLFPESISILDHMFKKLQKLEFVSLLHIPLKCVCADVETCTHNFINIKIYLEIIKLWFTPVISRADFHHFNKVIKKNVNTVVIGGWKAWVFQNMIFTKKLDCLSCFGSSK